MIFINPNEAFKSAIENGILSDNDTNLNFAGGFMYMYTKEGFHYFKNIVTREYLRSTSIPLKDDYIEDSKGNTLLTDKTHRNIDIHTLPRDGSNILA